MRANRHIIVATFALTAGLPAGSKAFANADFQTVARVLETRCISCHGVDEQKEMLKSNTNKPHHKSRNKRKNSKYQ